MPYNTEAEVSKEIKLRSILLKVKNLAGYGDMDSYRLLHEMVKVLDIPYEQLEDIIEGFAYPHTWNNAKIKLIGHLEGCLNEYLKLFE